MELQYDSEQSAKRRRWQSMVLYPNTSISDNASGQLINITFEEADQDEAESFYCFEVFGTPDETWSASFWHEFSISPKNTKEITRGVHCWVI